MQYYGCTVLIVANGNNVAIGHFGQYTGGATECATLENPAAVKKYIIRLMNDVMVMGSFDENTRAWILYASNTVGGESSPGYQAIRQNLVENDIIGSMIKGIPYGAHGSGTGEFPQSSPLGKAVIEWTPRAGGATMNVYISQEQPSWSQNFDCNGIPVGNQKRSLSAPACSPRTIKTRSAEVSEGPLTDGFKIWANSSGDNAPSMSMTAEPTDTGTLAGIRATPITSAVMASITSLCTYMGEEPPLTPEAFCLCGSSSLPLSTVSSAGSTIPESSSCGYSTLLPSASSVINDATPTPTTDSAACMVCTPYAANGADCSSISGCTTPTAQATVQVGSSPVHVGTLTSTELYTSISNALESLCPSVTQTTEMTSCETDTVAIGNIPYIESDDLNKGGELVVKVESSAYNLTSLRDAMIQSAAYTASNSTTGKNCYTADYATIPGKREIPSFWDTGRRWLGLEPRDRPHPDPEHATWCNAASFAGVQYFGPWARDQQSLSATDYLDASWEFKTQGGDFDCEFLQDLITALGVVTPEFAAGEIELGEAVDAVCTAAMKQGN